MIDGQQRLTTLTIFFKVLCLMEKNNSSFDRRFRLEDKELALLHNHNDRASFEKVLNLEELEDIEGHTKGKDNVIDAYNFFKDEIDIEKIDRQAILNSIMFVGIDLGETEDEQQIFDTINSLGVKLTTAELLKNFFFNRDDTEDYKVYWKSVFEQDDDPEKYWEKEITAGRLKRTLIDLFFYSYLQIKIQQTDLKINTEDKAKFSKVDTLFQSYKALIQQYKLDKKALLIEIKEYAELFQANFDPDITQKNVSSDFGIERINLIIFGLETSTLIPYVLFVLKNVADETQKNALFECIEGYIMRRIVVKANTKNYNQLFTERLILNKIVSAEQFGEYMNRRGDTTTSIPNDTELKNGFDTSVLVNKQAGTILYLIESKIRHKGYQATTLLGRDSYRLEHLMPKKWKNNWGSVADKEAEDFRNFKLKTLGNLAIITGQLNSSISNSQWSKKLGNQEKKGLKMYSGGIETLAPYLELAEWNEEEIQKRANFLFEEAKKIWRFEAI